MVSAISWLVRLGVGQGLFTLDQAKSVHAAVGDDAELLTFVQQLIDDAYVEDDRLGDLEQLAGIAMAKGEAGPPDEDPFAPASETAVSAPCTLTTRPRPSTASSMRSLRMSRTKCA